MAQSDDDLKALLAPTGIGRGAYGAQARDGVRGQVRDLREQHTVDDLLRAPLLAACLEEALAQFGTVLRRVRDRPPPAGSCWSAPR